jgi:hypothetical protein
VARRGATSGSNSGPSGDSATVESLRREIAQKDQLVRGLLLGAVAASRGPAETPVEKEARSVREAARVLDRRLFDAPADDAAASRLEREVQRVTSQLPSDVETDLVCASTLCRLVVRAETQSMQSAVLRVAEGLPKLFAGTTLLQTAPGESTLYMAPDPETLNTSTDPTQDGLSAERAHLAAER